MAIDTRALRTALGNFATGIVVVTARSPDGDLGMTMNSFNTVSLDPPLILFSIDRRALGLPAYEASEAYVVNVLAEGQDELSNRFARAGADKFNGVPFVRKETGAAVLGGCVANLECVPWQRYDGGDHVIFVARVVTWETNPARDPLLYFRGRYAAIGTVGELDWSMILF